MFLVDQQGKEFMKPISQSFRKNLIDSVSQGYGSKFIKTFRFILFWDKGQKSVIDFLEDIT